MKVCALIPAYNEEHHIAEVVGALVSQGYAVLVVDDCSSDHTSARAGDAGAIVVRHDVNRGKGGALATGFAWLRDHGYDGAICLDGDGQHDPLEIARFSSTAMRTGADIIVGTRMLHAHDMPPVRRVTNWFMSLVLSSLAGQRLTDTQSGYRFIKVTAWDRLGLSTSRFDAESEMLVRACRLGMIVREVPIRTIYGDETSHMRPVRDTLRWIRLVVRLSGHSH